MGTHYSSGIRRKKDNTFSLHRIFVGPRRCYPSPSQPARHGNVFSPLSGSEEEWDLEAGHRPNPSKSLHQKGEVQDGNTLHNSTVSSTRGLDGVHRPQGCLFSRSHRGKLSTISPLLRGQPSLTIYMPSLRVINFSSGFLKGAVGNSSSPENQGDSSTSLPGRPASLGTGQGATHSTQRASDFHTTGIRMDSEPGEEPVRPIAVSGVFGCPLRHGQRHHFVTGREDLDIQRQDPPSSFYSSSSRSPMPEDHWHYGGGDSDGEVGPMENEAFSEGLPSPVEGQQDPADSDYCIHEALSPMVAPTGKPLQLPFHPSHCLGDYNNRRQQQGLGCPLSGGSGSGHLGIPLQKDSVKHPGAESSLPSTSGVSASHSRLLGPTQTGQYHSSGIHKNARGDSKSLLTTRGRANHVLGPEKPEGSDSDICSRGSECSGRLSFSEAPRQQRVVSPRRSIQVDSFVGVPSGSRPVRLPLQQKDGKILFKVQGPSSVWGGRPDGEMVVQQSLCLSANSDHPPIPEEAQGRDCRGVSDNSLLAQQALVPSPNTPQCPRSVPSSIQTRPPVSGVEATPLPGSPAPKGLAFERGRLEALGCPDEVIPTLLSSRRSSTNRVYERIWAKFSSHMSSRSNSCDNLAIQDVLSFLQTGLDISLSVSSLRVQVSAISAFSGVAWAKHPLVQQFFKGAVRLRPQRKPRFPKWDLPLVLDFFAQLNRSLSVRELTLKTSFLIAITSAKRVSEIQSLGSKEPFITFFPDRVVLIPMLGTNPKVTSVFHENQDITLPTFKSTGGPDPHPLDVGATLNQYLEVTASFRQSEFLFVLFHGKNRGSRASVRSIAAWVVQAIQWAYREKGLAPPEAVTAHSTRSLSTSWAASRHVAPDVICRAASWSSINTFMTHYCVEPATLSSVKFGLKVLSADSVK